MSEPIQTAEELNRMLTLEVYGLKPPVAPKGFELGGWIVCGNKSEAWILQPDGHVLPASSIESYLHRLELRRVPEPPKPRTREQWFNVYESSSGLLYVSDSYDSRERAGQCASKDRIACQRIILTEGQFDSEPSVPKPERIEFEHTGETRLAKVGEWVLCKNGSVYLAEQEFIHEAYPILRRIEPTRV